MSNLFRKTSSNWARYDKYEWKEDKEGTLYITPSLDAKVSLYNPLKDSEQMVLKAVNLGLMCMDKKNTQEQLQNAIMDLLLTAAGFMTALLPHRLHHLPCSIFPEKSFYQRGKHDHGKISFLFLSL